MLEGAQATLRQPADGKGIDWLLVCCCTRFNVVHSGSLYLEHTQHAAHFQVPEGYRFERAPLRLAGKVIKGFGRGSRQMGVPTANLPTAPLAEQLRGLPFGVYFGCVL